MSQANGCDGTTITTTGEGREIARGRRHAADLLIVETGKHRLD